MGHWGSQDHHQLIHLQWVLDKVLSGGDLHVEDQGEVEAESHKVDMVRRLLDMKEERLQPTANRKWNNQLQKGKTFFVLISFVLF